MDFLIPNSTLDVLLFVVISGAMTLTLLRLTCLTSLKSKIFFCERDADD